MSPDTKLYKHRCRYESCPERWSRFPTNEADQNDIEQTTLKDPIVHRHIFNDLKWQTESFTIQSSGMRAVISTVLDKYQDLDLDVEKWTFKPPFMPLVHRWDRLLSLCESKDEGHEPEAAAKLLEFLTPILAPKVDALVKTRETGNVMFDDLWQIFAPHEFVITKFYGVEAVCRVTKYELVKQPPKPSYWEIHMEYIDWNGNRCGYAKTMIIIPEFAAYRRVTSLPAYPLSFHNSPSKIRKQMTERGRKFEALRGYHFQTCSGSKILLPPGRSEERPEVKLMLEQALNLCNLWNAMLLLDKANIFLGAHTYSNLARNKLVAIFLTKLKYYTGVCFLTTNRTASINMAFQSRVDLFLLYRDLTFKARKKV
ncbi:AAA family ATPase [Fusarium bulbicola]|nr:AAA family ATPase [Fusarium bulbicola]